MQLKKKTAVCKGSTVSLLSVIFCFQEINHTNTYLLSLEQGTIHSEPKEDDRKKAKGLKRLQEEGGEGKQARFTTQYYTFMIEKEDEAGARA